MTDVTHGPSGIICRPEVDAADALGCGHSIKMLVQTGRIPAVTAAPFLRLAESLLAAARAEAAQHEAVKAEGAVSP